MYPGFDKTRHNDFKNHGWVKDQSSLKIKFING